MAANKRKALLFLCFLVWICISCSKTHNSLTIQTDTFEGNTRINTALNYESVYRMKIGVIDSGFAMLDNLNLQPVNSITNNHSIHGSAVAAIIGSKKTTEIPFQGFLPDIMIYVYDIPESELNAKRLARAIDELTSEDIDLINISLGTFNNDPDLYKSVVNAVEKGTIIVASSGNSSTEDFNYPASYDIPGVLSVGALDKNTNILSSTTVNDKVDIYLIGEEVKSIGKDSISIFSGTSFATPIASSMIAMIKSKCKDYSPEELEDVIKGDYTNTYSGSWKGMKKKILTIDFDKVFNSSRCRV